MSELVSGTYLFPHIPRIAEKMFYRCDPCDAHVGTHPGTEKPLGSLANKPLRQARTEAHAFFDTIWRRGYSRRREAYNWLAAAMGIPEAHIGQMNAEQCSRVIQLCEGRK